MALLQSGTIGILPAGALGVSYFYYLTGGLTKVDGRVVFIERPGSNSGRAMRNAAELRIEDGETVRTVSLPEIWKPDPLQCAELRWLPEVLLICPQPDQILGVMNTMVTLLERLHAKGEPDCGYADLPVMVLCSNGIYFQRVRQFFVERLEESTLLGRLPDLWPNEMPKIVGKLLRGVTIQTGHREGSGAEARYKPGPLGRTRLAGGDAAQRQRCAGLLTSFGGWFDVASDISPTRAEFDKALVNLAANLLGQLTAIDSSGRFRLMTIREIFAQDGERENRELAEHVFAVGKAVHAYRADEDFEQLYAAVKETMEHHLDHVPSSLQWIAAQLRRGQLQPRLTPTEAWLLEPLIRYAHASGLEKPAHYFEELTRRVERRLSLAIAASR